MLCVKDLIDYRISEICSNNLKNQNFSSLLTMFATPCGIRDSLWKKEKSGRKKSSKKLSITSLTGLREDERCDDYYNNYDCYD